MGALKLALFRVVLASSLLYSASSATIKILCLHGGGGTGSSFRTQISGLRNSFPEVEFVFPNGGYPEGNEYLWVPDPPGGKGEPTTDPNIAAASFDALDEVVQNQGPFFGILGYSQGSMFVSAYLSHAPADTFKVAMMFAGYLPETHQGLLNSIEASSPFNNIPALVWMGGNDFVISNALTQDQADLYVQPFIIRNPSASHVVPDSSDSTYIYVVEWLENYIASNGTQVENPELPDDLNDAFKPTITLQCLIFSVFLSLLGYTI